MVAVHPGEIIQRPAVLQHPSSPMHVARPAPRVLPSLRRLIGSSLASCPVRCRPTCGERECRCGSWSLACIYCTSSTVGGGLGNSRRAVCGRRGACHEREARGRSRCSNIVLVGSIACVCRCSNKGETRSHRFLLGCCRVASGNECETRRRCCLRLRCSSSGIFGLDLGTGGKLLLGSTAATDEGETRSWCHVCLGLGACGRLLLGSTAATEEGETRSRCHVCLGLGTRDGRLLSGTTASNEGESRGRRRHFRLGRCNRLHLFRCNWCKGNFRLDFGLLFRSSAADEAEARRRRGLRWSFAAVIRRRRDFRLVHGGLCNTGLFRCSCCKGSFGLDLGLLFRSSAADEAEARCRRGRRCSFAAVARRRWDLRLVHGGLCNTGLDLGLLFSSSTADEAEARCRRGRRCSFAAVARRQRDLSLVHGGPCNTGLLCLLRSARHLRIRLRNRICIGGLWRR
mmetsp:Transcript_183315/g.581314  ORF Transcript_183315/g.581314 Transcript_183315/m.581314 type:complete len:456 (+) Transcript_183315:89-1456(+)